VQWPRCVNAPRLLTHEQASDASSRRCSLRVRCCLPRLRSRCVRLRRLRINSQVVRVSEMLWCMSQLLIGLGEAGEYPDRKGQRQESEFSLPLR
jgi:hypothetical protein